MDSEEQSDHRPMPGPGDTESKDAGDETTEPAKSEIPEPKEGEGKIGLDRDDETQDFVDQSKIDFDPDEGLYSGTAVDGTSEIPGPHAEDGDEASVLEQAKEMAGDDPPESEATVGVLARGQQKREQDDGDGDDSDDSQDSDKDGRTPDSSDEQAYS